MQRYFGSNNNKNLLSDNDIHHIKKVMRMKVGDEIEIVIDSFLYKMKINSLSPLKFDEISKDKLKNDKKINVTLAQALVREQKWGLILQKATELGVDNIIPLKLERCNVKFDESKISKKFDRWNLIVKEASEQSFRNDIPNLLSITDLKKMDLKKYDLKIFCSTKKDVTPLKNILQKSKKYDNILIVVGPEGGLTDSEEKNMLEKNFLGVSLATSILRTETASFYTLSVINYEFRSE